MCDIVNCPNKKGSTVLHACEKQWARYGLYKDDCVGGTGDGGGENEGAEGLHSLLEDNRPDYVRRRCMGHFPRRVADQGLAASGDVYEAIKAISSYLHEGITWNRLKAISVKPELEGGIGVFNDGSEEFFAFFLPAPPKSMDERPDTTVAILGWLDRRPQILTRLVRHDIATRELQGKANKIARASLTNTTHQVMRRVLYIMLKKAMYVYYYIEKHVHVALNIPFDTLMANAKDIMTGTACDKYILEMINCSLDEVTDAVGDISGKHWVEVAVRMSPGLTAGEKDSLVEPAAEFHDKLATRMQAHLSLNAKSIMRSTWTAARTRGALGGGGAGGGGRREDEHEEEEEGD